MAGSETPASLPPDLPRPMDDGACDHLLGAALPVLSLPSTRGHRVDLARATESRTVLFFYPAATGRADTPPEWDLIPGARGCTPQNCAYRDQFRDFRELRVEVYGISAQTPEAQRDFSDRFHLPYELLSDAQFELTRELRLPTFEFRRVRYIRRLTLVAVNRRVEHVFYPVFPPDQSAREVLEYLRRGDTGRPG